MACTEEPSERAGVGAVVKRFAFIFLTGCFAEPPVDDDSTAESVDESSSSGEDDSGSEAATSDGDSIGDESTGSAVLSCSTDAICVVGIFSADPFLHDDVAEHEYPCPAPPVSITWLDGGDVMTSVTMECDAQPDVIEMPRAPNGWRIHFDGCTVEELDATPMCAGSGTCPLGGPELGDTAIFTIGDPRLAPC